MNWGKGLILGMGIFMLFIICMCIYMYALPVDDYDHLYYEKGLNFDHDYDREGQVVKDHARPLILLEKHRIKLTFAQPVKGAIAFMRPSDMRLDKNYNLDSGAGNEVDLPLDSVAPGKWQLIMQWQSNKKAYLYQEGIFIK